MIKAVFAFNSHMKKVRILRDLVILVIGVGVIFGIVTLFNSFDFGEQSGTPDNLSAERQRADSSVEENDWVAAIPDNLKLLERDPFDGHAWFRLAQGRYRLAVDSHAILLSINDTEGVESDVASVAWMEMETRADEAIECFEKCVDFARYRRASLANIAYLHSLCGRERLAIKYLGKAVKDGYFGRRTPRRFGTEMHRFVFLAHLPAFLPLRVQEHRNSEGYFVPADASDPFYVQTK